MTAKTKSRKVYIIKCLQRVGRATYPRVFVYKTLKLREAAVKSLPEDGFYLIRRATLQMDFPAPKPKPKKLRRVSQRIWWDARYAPWRVGL